MLIPLKLVRDQPLQQQLYDQLRALIVAGRLRPGARMPSTRMMAEQFAISRITALLSYERLIAEGYLETAPAKGTFVARGGSAAGSERLMAMTQPGGQAPPPSDLSPLALVGRPDPVLFPAGRWRALTRNALERFGAQLAKEHAQGHPALRAAIAGWLSTSRGLAVAPEQVLLVNGRQQALHVAAHLLLAPGARVVVEDPCDQRAAAVFTNMGAELLRVPVDADGLCTRSLPGGRVALAHVTPEHQRPLGVSLHGSRRAELLAWAERRGAMILEEDCDGELRYHGMEVPPLMSLDTSGLVILLGGFQCSLGPWLTLAYMVVPERLIPAAAAARRLIDDGPRWLEEAALAEFLQSGGYARHVHRLGKVYASRRDALVAALAQCFGTGTPCGGGAGLHLSWPVPPALGPAGLVADMARHCGLEAAAQPVPGRQVVLLGFGNLNEHLLETGVRQLAAHCRGADAQAAE